jgi:hypothetical protein
LRYCAKRSWRVDQMLDGLSDYRKPTDIGQKLFSVSTDDTLPRSLFRRLWCVKLHVFSHR